MTRGRLRRPGDRLRPATDNSAIHRTPLPISACCSCKDGRGGEGDDPGGGSGGEEVPPTRSLSPTATLIARCSARAPTESSSRPSTPRDMKPNNLLIASDEQLKLADFGLARTFGSPDHKLTLQVFARWYRAPELIYGAKQYGAGVDVWAAGCIFAELLLRRPVMQGTSDIDQLGKIFASFGTPNHLNGLVPLMGTRTNKVIFASKASRPPPKGESQSHKSSDFTSHDGPVILSPQRKVRRVTIYHDGLDGNSFHLDKAGEHVKEGRHTDSVPSGGMPMSIDVGALFGSRPPLRPTLNSADRSHLKRKLNLDLEFDYEP